MYSSGAIYAKGNSCQVTDGIEVCKKYLPDLTPDMLYLILDVVQEKSLNIWLKAVELKLQG